MLATAATSRAKPGWSGKEESAQEEEEEAGKEGNKRESEKKASRGSCVDLRLPSPKRERAICERWADAGIEMRNRRKRA